MQWNDTTSACVRCVQEHWYRAVDEVPTEKTRLEGQTHGGVIGLGLTTCRALGRSGFGLQQQLEGRAGMGKAASAIKVGAWFVWLTEGLQMIGRSTRVRLVAGSTATSS